MDNSYSIQDATHTESKITKTQDIDQVSEHVRGLYTHNGIICGHLDEVSEGEAHCGPSGNSHFNKFPADANCKSTVVQEVSIV